MSFNKLKFKIACWEVYVKKFLLTPLNRKRFLENKVKLKKKQKQELLHRNSIFIGLIDAASCAVISFNLQTSCFYN